MIYYARAGSQSTIHPELTGRRRARATYRTHGFCWADRNSKRIASILAEHFITAVDSFSHQLLASIWMMSPDNASTSLAPVSIINEQLLPEVIAKEEGSIRRIRSWFVMEKKLVF
jgi:hypothetical protein